MLVADSHEFIETYRGARDLRLGMEIVRMRDDVRFLSFGPDILSPYDQAIRGVSRLADIELPELPDRMELRTLPGRVVQFARREAGGKFVLMRGYGRALAGARPDVILENPYTWLTPRNYTTHRVANRLGVPVIYYDPGDDMPVSAKQTALAVFERPVVNDAYAIVTFNGAGRRRFITKYGYPAERIHVIPKPVDVAEWRPAVDRADVLAGFGVPADAFVVTYVGRLARGKGSRVLADVARRALDDPALADWRFLFVGSTLDQAENEADYAIPNAHITGMLPNEEVPRILAASDVVVFPDVTHPGGFWTSIAETMAAGRPLVMGAPANQDFVPMIDGETGILVEPGSAEATLERLKELCSRPGLRARLADAVGKYATENMDYPKVASAYLELLDEAVEDRA